MFFYGYKKILSQIPVGNIFNFEIKHIYLDFASDNQELSEIDLNSKAFPEYVTEKITGRVGI